MLMVPTKSIKSSLYDDADLICSVARAAQTLSAKEFLDFQCKVLSEFEWFPEFSGCWVNLRSINPSDGRMLRSHAFEAYNLDQAMIDRYARFQHIEPVIMNRHKAIGCYASDADFLGEEVHYESEFFEKYKKPMGVNAELTCAYGIPFSGSKLIYMSFTFPSKGGRGRQMKELFEVTMCPFYIGWLRVFDFIDSETMVDWLSVVSALTPMQLAVLREVVAQEQFRTKESAEKLGISHRTLQNHISHICEAISGRKWFEHSLVTLDLVKNFEFLRFIGANRSIDSLSEVAMRRAA